MKELAYHSMQVDMNLMQLSKEMKDFKEEMKDFKMAMGDSTVDILNKGAEQSYKLAEAA